MKKRGSSSTVLRKLDKLNLKVDSIAREEKKIEREEKSVESKEMAIQKEQEKVERVLFQIGNFTFRRRHLLELIRGTAGAFLGVGLGRILLNTEDLAQKLPWWNVMGIMCFILIISGLLIYKNEKSFVKKRGFGIILRRLLFLYVISLLVEFLSLWLFLAVPGSFVILVKVLIIGRMRQWRER